MDHFGSGAGVQAAVAMYFACARRTGRTTSLVESLKDGDRVVFASVQESRRVEQLCKERGLTKVKFIVIDPSHPGRLFERPTSEGRTIFDHQWVESFYTKVVLQAAKDLDHLERESSGYGAAHRETRRKMEELYRWSSGSLPQLHNSETDK